MAPPALQHYGHDPSHHLSETISTTTSTDQQEIFCSACKYSTTSKFHHCNICNFTLHPFCHTCPTTLTSSTLHPSHPLQLISSPSNLNPLYCNVCADVIHGTYFTCSTCDFDIHPLCSQIPRHFHHPTLDPKNHPLKLSYGKINRVCDVCGISCHPTFCLYSCAECNVDAHCHCILGQLEAEVGGDDPNLSAAYVYQLTSANLAQAMRSQILAASLHIQETSPNVFLYRNSDTGPTYRTNSIPWINGYTTPVVQGGFGSHQFRGGGGGGGSGFDYTGFNGGGSAAADASSLPSGFDWSSLAEMDCSRSALAEVEKN